MKMNFVTAIFLLGILSCGTNTSRSTASAISAPEQDVVLVLDPDASDSNISWDKTVHDFGDVSVEDGPLSCTFTITNNGSEPVAIFEVVSSCGCTDVKWTREPLMPGKSGTISATYKNEDGPTAFDKTLTVYISGVKKPVVLRLRGVVHEKKKSLSQLFGAQKLGDFGIKTRELKLGTLRQGLSASESVTVANLGSRPLTVSFADVSPQLSLTVTPNPIPAGATANLTYTVAADPSLYGRNAYFATPVLNGSKAAGSLSVMAFTQENFAAWSESERDNAAIPMFENSTVSFGVVSAGSHITASFTCKNRGKAPLHIYKADSEDPALTLTADIPDIPAGNSSTIDFSLDTSLLAKGDCVIMLSLTTNSPLRPVVNLFVTGEIR